MIEKQGPIKATKEDVARDLIADLELCEAATPAPWTDDCNAWPFGEDNLVCWPFVRSQPDPGRDNGVSPLVCCMGSDEDYPNAGADAAMIAAAREGWPAAIRRALAAESRVAELEARGNV